MTGIRLVLVLLNVIFVLGTEEVNFSKVSSAIKFIPADKLTESDVVDVFSTILGYSTYSESTWKGMSVLSPFHLPQAMFVLDIPGAHHLTVAGHHYPTVGIEWDLVGNELQKTVDAHQPTATVRVNIAELRPNLHPDEVIGNFVLRSLDMKQQVDQDFISDLVTLESITLALAQQSNKLVWLSFASLDAVCDYHGNKSPQCAEARKLLQSVIQSVSTVLGDVYNNEVAVVIISRDGLDGTKQSSFIQKSTRAKRAVKLGTLPSGLIAHTSANWAPIFNIMIWLFIVLGVALVFICLGIAGMDPGRDSIIYRMTQQRIKKDN